MRRIAQTLAATIVAAAALTACSSSDGSDDAPTVDAHVACTEAIQAIADRGGKASTPPECSGLTDAEIGEIARRVYAAKYRKDHAS